MNMIICWKGFVSVFKLRHRCFIGWKSGDILDQVLLAIFVLCHCDHCHVGKFIFCFWFKLTLLLTWLYRNPNMCLHHLQIKQLFCLHVWILVLIPLAPNCESKLAMYTLIMLAPNWSKHIYSGFSWSKNMLPLFIRLLFMFFDKVNFAVSCRFAVLCMHLCPLQNQQISHWLTKHTHFYISDIPTMLEMFKISNQVSVMAKNKWWS